MHSGESTVRSAAREYVSVVALVMLLVFVDSYAVETLLSLEVDLTVPFGLLAAMTTGFGVFVSRQIGKPHLEDFAVALLVLSIGVAGVINPRTIEAAIAVIMGSVLPYYVARLVPASSRALGQTVRSVFISVGISYSLVVLLYVILGELGQGNRVHLGGANPIAAAEVVGLGTVAALIQWVSNGRGRGWLLLPAGLIGLAAQMIGLGARGSVLAAITAIAPFLLRDVKRIWPLVAGLLVLLGGTVVVLPEASLGAIARFDPKYLATDQALFGEGGRQELWRESVRIIASAPIFGAGIGTIYSHNLFLELGAATGLPGIGTLVLVLVAIPWGRLIRACWYDETARLLTALFMYLLVYRQSSFSLMAHKSLFVILGLLINVAQRVGPRAVNSRDSYGPSSKRLA